VFQVVFSFWISHQYPICIPLLPIHATCPAHLILLDLIILIIRDNLVSKINSYRLGGWGSIPGMGTEYLLLYLYQTDFMADPTSFAVGL
jgi:hypothetical protein